MNDIANGILVLKTGERLPITTDRGRGYDPTSLTSKAIHTFVGHQKQVYVVQGDNIAYIEVKA
jgi:uncharacterized protein (DUF2249 family)